MKYDLSILIFSSGSGHILINDSKYAFPTVLPNADRMKNNIKTVCGIEKYDELSKRKGFLNQLRFYWFVLCASLRDFRKKKTIKEE